MKVIYGQNFKQLTRIKRIDTILLMKAGEPYIEFAIAKKDFWASYRKWRKKEATKK